MCQIRCSSHSVSCCTGTPTYIDGDNLLHCEGGPIRFWLTHLDLCREWALGTGVDFVASYRDQNQARHTQRYSPRWVTPFLTVDVVADAEEKN